MHLLRSLCQLLYLGLVLFVFFHHFVEAALFFFNEKAVVSGVKLRLAIHYLNTALRNGVQKPSVMADRQNSTLEVVYIIFEPFGGVEVKMVGRLVQKEDIRVLKNEAGKIDPCFFTAGELAEKALAHRGRDIETVCNTAALKLGVIAAETLEVGCEAVVLTEDLLGGVFFHKMSELVNASAYGINSVMSGFENILGGIVGGVDGDLGNKTEPFSFSHKNFAVIVVDLT